MSCQDDLQHGHHAPGSPRGSRHPEDGVSRIRQATTFKVTYHLGPRFDVVGAGFEDAFWTTRAARVARGELPQVGKDEYKERLRRAVRWHDGREWTDAPAIIDR